MCTGFFTTDNIRMSKKVCSISSELSQSSIRPVSSKKDSSTLSILESQEYVSKNNQNTLNNDVPYFPQQVKIRGYYIMESMGLLYSVGLLYNGK